MSVVEVLRAVVGGAATVCFVVILAVEAWEGLQWRRFRRAVRARTAR